jgi:hypothetical protein
MDGGPVGASVRGKPVTLSERCAATVLRQVVLRQAAMRASAGARPALMAPLLSPLIKETL